MSIALQVPVVNVFRKLGMEPDDWQLKVVEGSHQRLLLNCSRQAGKSTVAGLLALLEALCMRGAVILLLSRSQRQSAELFRIVSNTARKLKAPHIARHTKLELEFESGSRIVSLPCNADTIRGFSGVHMLIIDEAARVPDVLYRTVRPMLAATDGRLLCLSTPNGKHGFFWDAWAHGGADWERIEIPAGKVDRISAGFLEQERRSMPEAWYRQEYECSFEAMEGLVYPDFHRCVATADEAAKASAVLASGRREVRESPRLVVVRSVNPADLRKVGGIDFGFRNPFAAVWGYVDHDGVLWLTGEHYASQQPLSYHARQLPRDVTWYADPAGASDIAELRCAGFIMRKGNNALRDGIMAVSSRIRNGTLKVLPGACPNLLREASLYRWARRPIRKRPRMPTTMRWRPCATWCRGWTPASRPGSSRAETKKRCPSRPSDRG